MAQLSIRIDLGPDFRIGPGKIALLEMIARHGSISAAGRALGMSYRRAWMLVEAMNTGFGRPVVEAQSGGRAGRGARRRVTLRGPVLATLHPDAPAPLPFAYGQARRGAIETVAGDPDPSAAPVPALEERPYRRRPKLVKGAPSGGSAAERLRAATGEAASGGGRLLVRPEPDEAAREILAHLRLIGVLAPPTREPR